MAFCGLTQEKLDKKGWINSDQKCIAKCAGGVECTKYYSEHPAGGKDPISDNGICASTIPRAAHQVYEPPSCIKRPSDPDEAVVQRHYALGRLADLPELIALQVAVGEDKLVQRIIDEGSWLYHSIPLTCTDTFGFWKKELKVYEQNVTAVFAELLLISILRSETVFPGILRVHHQPKPDSSSLDVYVGEWMELDGGHGTLPRMVIEVGITSPGDKSRQTFSYINNLAYLWPKERQFLMLGLTALPKIGSVRLSAFYLSHDAAKGSSHISEVLLFEDRWCAKSLARVLSALSCLCSNPPSRITTTRPVPRRCSGVNHYIDDEKQHVYKIFDYRENNRLSRDRRRPNLSLAYLQGCSIVCQETDLTIIRYPFIVGDHIPQQCGHLLSVLLFLLAMHKDNRVFADLRLSNCIFKSDGSASLVDFDLAGESDVDKYPRGFSLVDDGVRHPQAVGGKPLLPQHDLFALAGLMDFFVVSQSEKDQQQKQNNWVEAARLIRDGRCEAARNLLASMKTVTIVQKQPLPTHLGATGSPQQPLGATAALPPPPPIAMPGDRNTLAAAARRSRVAFGASTAAAAASTPAAAAAVHRKPKNKVAHGHDVLSVPVRSTKSGVAAVTAASNVFDDQVSRLATEEGLSPTVPTPDAPLASTQPPSTAKSKKRQNASKWKKKKKKEAQPDRGNEESLEKIKP